MPLLLGATTRKELWALLTQVLEQHATGVSAERVAPHLDPMAIRRALGPFDFATPCAAEDVVEFTVQHLREDQVHTDHPAYFGLYNPAPTTMGIVADALVASFNPQLAAWSHSPFAAEVEEHLIRLLGERMGYPGETIEGTMCSGGMEANHTAVITALTAKFPQFARDGLRALEGQPVLYLTREAHDSFRKAARVCGLGTAAAVEIETDSRPRMDPAVLEEQILSDRQAGQIPFLVVATLGTTGAGVVDPVGPITEIAAREGLWCHADAAWGGAAALVPELRPLFAGIESADSITIDAHKWLSVPMGAGLLITRRPGMLEAAFRVAESYMPKDAQDLPIRDPYAHSMQWSRRFIGLKLFLSLAVAGWQGYEQAIRRMTEQGNLLRKKLERAAWRVVNDTELPVVCFDDPSRSGHESAEYLERVCAEVVRSGRAWISFARIGGGHPVLRACICNYRTEENDLEVLVDALDAARKSRHL